MNPFGAITNAMCLVVDRKGFHSSLNKNEKLKNTVAFWNPTAGHKTHNHTAVISLLPPGLCYNSGWAKIVLLDNELLRIISNNVYVDANRSKCNTNRECGTPFLHPSSPSPGHKLKRLTSVAHHNYARCIIFMRQRCTTLWKCVVYRNKLNEHFVKVFSYCITDHALLILLLAYGIVLVLFLFFFYFGSILLSFSTCWINSLHTENAKFILID